MEEGINILTQAQNVRVEGAEELIEDWENGKITMEELRTKILDLETVYVDLTKVVEPTQFKDNEE
tara:strand:+ start:307 stop:501 length:195 start_codon:yes stop_codon:yes gene_type:complete